MIHDIPKPRISPAFTLEDIHKIRDWQYRMLKDSTFEERREFYARSSEEFRALRRRHAAKAGSIHEAPQV